MAPSPPGVNDENAVLTPQNLNADDAENAENTETPDNTGNAVNSENRVIAVTAFSVHLRALRAQVFIQQQVSVLSAPSVSSVFSCLL